jgi:hypothetical protein
MVSADGRGIASAWIMAFYDSCDELDLVEAIPSRSRGDEDSSSDEVVPEVAQRARARSEKIGFWVVWHQSGGFKAREHAGWHRTTIFRKLRRFRATFGVHPDDWSCDWITLDLEKFWKADFDTRIAAHRGLLDLDDSGRNRVNSIPSLTRENRGAGDGNRTRMTSLEGWDSAIELRPRSAQDYLSSRGGLGQGATGNPC